MTVTVTRRHHGQTITTEHETQLDADLQTGIRGGNKPRLIARCWLATGGANASPDDQASYERFRAQWMLRKFSEIHDAFDHALPPEHQPTYKRTAALQAAREAARLAAAEEARKVTPATRRMAAGLERARELQQRHRDWIERQGGLEALDKAELLLPNGKTCPLLGGCTYLDLASRIDRIMARIYQLLLPTDDD